MDIKRVVKEGYGKIAKAGGSCCGTTSCCGGTVDAGEISRNIGYSDDELAAVPEGANLGLGCGNPTALAALKEGETVVDLGSGAGFDCFLAARKVGPTGRVIGIDMTPEMIARSRRNAETHGIKNVEFRPGEIEEMPLPDNGADVVISNCVINLSPDKPRVFREAFRVLKPGGRLLVSDLVLVGDLPDAVKASAAGYVGCLSGAIAKEEYLAAMQDAGFVSVAVAEENPFPVENMMNDATAQALAADPGVGSEDVSGVASAISSIKVSGVKPV